jgi:hypothetical protein
MNSTVRESRFDSNPRKAKWLVFLVCFGFLEIICRLLVSAGLLHHEIHPTTTRPVFWAYIDPVVGMWRYPNTEIHHKTDCVDQVYQSNSLGARDPERLLQSSAASRVVVLGDSMVEGYGLADAERVTNLLEARTGIEHLNFGTAGSFGTIQQWLYYREYASKFEHSDVYVFIFPVNDFDDNDIGKWKSSIYRPYLRKNEAGYEVYYPVEFENRSQNTRPTAKIIKNSIENNVYVFNAIRWGLHVYKEKKTGGEPLFELPTKPSYADYSAEDFRMMAYALDGIVAAAADRRVHIYTIPVETDVEAALTSGYDFPLVNDLTQFASRYSNVRYTDLLPATLDYMRAKDVPYVDLTLMCNRHWGPLGSKVAADSVSDAVINGGAD